MIVFGAVLLWFASETFLYYRDNFSTHYPIKSVTARIVKDGLPLWNPFTGGGQPLAGNPNSLTFYPTTILFLFLPAHLAFNLHFMIHLVVGWLGMRWLLRNHDVGDSDAARVSWVYVLSGTTVSCLVFYNLIVAAALMPWALASLVRLLRDRDRRDALYLGCFCGLIGLAAEPVVVIGFTIVAIIVFAFHVSGRAITGIFTAMIVGSAIASPQLISYFEIAEEVERGHFPYSAETALAASLGPLRMAEIVIGPVYGSVLDHSRHGYWANQSGRKWPPFFPSVLLSSLAIPALFRRSRGEIRCYQASLVLLLLLALGKFNPAITALVEKVEILRIFRYPEKFALILTLVGSVLIGLLIRDLRRQHQAFRVPAFIGIGIITTIATIVLSATDLDPVTSLRIAGVSALQIIVLIPLIVPDRIPRLMGVLLLSSLLPLGFWAAQIVPVDRAIYYTTPSPLAMAVGDDPIDVLPSSLPWDAADARSLYRYYAFRLEPTSGIRFGSPYVLSASPEGMHFYLSRLATERYRTVAPELGIRYLQIHGANWTIRSRPISTPWTNLASSWSQWQKPILLYEITGSRPFLWEPRSIIRVEHPTEAVTRIESDQFDPKRDTVVPDWLDESIRPSGSARLRVLSRTSQELEIEIETAEETIVIVNQTFFSAWRATIDQEELTTFPADLDRLGIVVPRGRSVIRLEFSRLRPAIFLALASSLSILLYGIGLAIWSRRRTAVPAR